MIINLSDDTAEFLGEKVSLHLTSNDHYCMCILPNSDSNIVNVCTATAKESDSSELIYQPLLCFNNISNSEQKKLLTKLHKQFGHANYDKLRKLLNDAGSFNESLGKNLQDVVKSCVTCVKHKKGPPRPVVSLPWARSFNDTVAMDLKIFDNNSVIMLHMIDMFSRYSRAVIIPNKKSETVVQQFIMQWISIFGAPRSILSDNGNEFVASQEVMDMCHNFNIQYNSTPAYSSYSNGICERHNAILARTLMKIMDSEQCNYSTALAWALSAKNSLSNRYGFSPIQIAFGHNPNLPNVLNDKAPALEGKTFSHGIASHLNALHCARVEYIKAESADKIRRALRLKVRDHRKMFTKGQKVYIKRPKHNVRIGPATVIGQDSAVVIVRNGSRIITAHSSVVEPIECIDDVYDNFNLPLPAEAVKEDNLFDENDFLLLYDDYNTPLVEQNNVEQNNISIDDLSRDINSNIGEHPTNIDDLNKSIYNADRSPINIEDLNKGTTRIANVDNPSCSTNTAVPNNHITSSSINIEDLNKGTTTIANVDTSNPGCSTNTAVPNNRITSFKKLKLFPNQQVRFKNANDQECVAKILSRAGKASGKYANTYNVEYSNPAGKCGETEYVDFDRMNEFELVSENIDADIDVLITTSNKPDDITYNDAKKAELQSWDDNNVYSCVKNTGQRCISTRWVNTLKNNNGIITPKSRLVVRGYEEYNKQFISKESPTCSREAIRIALSISQLYGWDLRIIDIKTAFLQGNENLLNRDIFVIPPKEANCNDDVIWKMNKAVYGLVDASKKWYDSVKCFMLENGGTQSTTDPSVFYWHSHDNNVHGCILSYVDDFLWFGNNNFKLFIIDKLCNTFTISKHINSNFKYIGLNLSTLSDNSRCLDQVDYCSKLDYINIPLTLKQKEDSNQDLPEKERKLLRSKIGQLLWLSCQSRPDLCFEVCKLSNNFKNANVGELVNCNKIIKKANANPLVLRYNNLGDINNLKLVVYADASFGNLPDGGSQGVFLIFIVGSNNVCHLIAWQSKRIKRIVRSTLAAETLSLSDAVESAGFVQSLFKEMCFGKLDGELLPIEAFTDNKSLHSCIYSTKAVLDRRLRVDIGSLRELLSDKKLSAVRWISNEKQLADILTKSGPSSNPLQMVLSKGQLYF